MDQNLYHTSDFVPLRDTAVEYCLQGRYVESFNLYKQILSGYDKQSPGLFSEVAYVCWQLGKIAEAEELFSRALETG
jgi:tetratricopeptide (TPR) repeat protein